MNTAVSDRVSVSKRPTIVGKKMYAKLGRLSRRKEQNPIRGVYRPPIGGVVQGDMGGGIGNFLPGSHYQSLGGGYRGLDRRQEGEERSLSAFKG